MHALQHLYIWLEGDITNSSTPPDIHTKIAPTMPLTEFRDKYVDTSRPYVIVRVYNAHDDNGQEYHVALVPIAQPIQAETSAAESPPGTSLTLIKGIGRKIAAQLHQVGIDSIEALREHAATPQGQAQLALQLRKKPALILRWAQQAALMQVNGIGQDYGWLLWQAGITTIAELREQTPHALESILESTNRRLRLVDRLPAREQIEDWIAQAQTLQIHNTP